MYIINSYRFGGDATSIVTFSLSFDTPTFDAMQGTVYLKIGTSTIDSYVISPGTSTNPLSIVFSDVPNASGYQINFNSVLGELSSSVQSTDHEWSPDFITWTPGSITEKFTVAGNVLYYGNLTQF